MFLTFFNSDRNYRYMETPLRTVTNTDTEISQNSGNVTFLQYLNGSKPCLQFINYDRSYFSTHPIIISHRLMSVKVLYINEKVRKKVKFPIE